MNEFSFIKWIRGDQKKDKNVIIGIGDDCASIRINDDNVFLVTTDMLVEGTHFDLKKVHSEKLEASLSPVVSVILPRWVVRQNMR